MTTTYYTIKISGLAYNLPDYLTTASFFQELVEDPLLAGGCPILNTAIEADDAHAGLRDRARRAMDNLRATLRRIIAKGIERHELRPSIDADACSTVFIVTLEGGGDAEQALSG